MPAPYVTLYYLGTQYHAPADAVERAGLQPWQHIDGEDMKRLKGVLPASPIRQADSKAHALAVAAAVAVVVAVALVWLVLR